MSDSPSKEPKTVSMDLATLIAAVAVILFVMATSIALAFSGMKEEAIVALLTALTSIVGLLVVILGKVATLHQTARKIETATNGALQATIKNTVEQTMAQYFKPSETPTPKTEE